MKNKIETHKDLSENTPDELNPELLFNLTYNKLLVDIIAGKIDLIKLAKQQLKNRGYNESGEYIGFK
ncbi:MAG: hypothetical protein LBT27_06415 [Prevotellaceae bacterium]|jgi:hypothetical protein|nr:hypothetical protein [Prevotellaceae bacterium]